MVLELQHSGRTVYHFPCVCAECFGKARPRVVSQLSVHPKYSTGGFSLVVNTWSGPELIEITKQEGAKNG